MIGLLRQKKQVKYQPWHGWLLLAIILIFIVLSIMQRINPEPAPTIVMSEISCESAGGSWNPCGSACAESSEACIQVCVAQCECATSDVCPAGWECGKSINDNDVCIKSSQQ